MRPFRKDTGNFFRLKSVPAICFLICVFSLPDPFNQSHARAYGIRCAGIRALLDKNEIEKAVDLIESDSSVQKDCAYYIGKKYLERPDTKTALRWFKYARKYSRPDSLILTDILYEILLLDPDALDTPARAFDRIRRASPEKAAELENTVEQSFCMALMFSLINPQNDTPPPLHSFWKKKLKFSQENKAAAALPENIEPLIQKINKMTKDVSTHENLEAFQNDWRFILSLPESEQIDESREKLVVAFKEHLQNYIADKMAQKEYDAAHKAIRFYRDDVYQPGEKRIRALDDLNRFWSLETRLIESTPEQFGRRVAALDIQDRKRLHRVIAETQEAFASIKIRVSIEPIELTPFEKQMNQIKAAMALAENRDDLIRCKKRIDDLEPMDKVEAVEREELGYILEDMMAEMDDGGQPDQNKSGRRKDM